MTSIEDQSRVQIAEFLPDAIAKALTSYRVYMAGQKDDTLAAFKEKHLACKAAIAHIELLLKLARWADLPDARALNQNDQVILAALVEAAEEELAEYEVGRNSAEN